MDIPVELDEGRLGEDIEVALELLDRLDDGGRAVGPAHLGGQRHDVLCLLFLRFALELARPDLDAGDVVGEERQDIDMGVLEQLVASILGKGLAEMGLVLAIGRQQLDHGGLGVLGDVLDQACQGHRQGRDGVGRHRGWQVAEAGVRTTG